MKHWVLASLLTISFSAAAQAPSLIGKIPTEEDCLAFIAILPTFENERMRSYYETNPNAGGKDLVERLQSLADDGEKSAQFTYSMLLLNGYCVPKDACVARRYLLKSRGGLKDWEQLYPPQPWPKDIEKICN